MSTSCRRLVLSLLVLLSAPQARAEGALPPSVTLDDAVRMAIAQSPELAARRASIDEARARLVTAGTYPFNPELTITAGRRRSDDASGTDSGLELSQELELAGQTGRRAAAARHDVEAEEAGYRRAAQFLAARVELSFADALRAAQGLEVDEADVALADSSLDVARRKLEAGASTDLEVNLAVATHARASARLQQSRAAAELARYLLAEAIGIAPDSAPLPAPTEPDLGRDVGPLEPLLALAREHRDDLASFRALVRAADARLKLSHAERAPSLRVGLFHDREAGGDAIDGASVGISLPIFNRGRGAVAEAVAGRARAEAEGLAATRTVEREVAESWATWRAARQTAEQLGRDVVGSMEDSLDLLRKSQEAGKIGMTEVLLFRRELLDSRRDYVAAKADAWRARILLDLAAGLTKVPEQAAGPAATEARP